MKRLIPTKVVANKVGRSLRWVFQKIQDGEFPKPVQRGLFSEKEVDDWIDAQIAKRDQQMSASA